MSNVFDVPLPVEPTTGDIDAAAHAVRVFPAGPERNAAADRSGRELVAQRNPTAAAEAESVPRHKASVADAEKDLAAAKEQEGRWAPFSVIRSKRTVVAAAETVDGRQIVPIGTWIAVPMLVFAAMCFVPFGEGGVAWTLLRDAGVFPSIEADTWFAWSLAALFAAPVVTVTIVKATRVWTLQDDVQRDGYIDGLANEVRRWAAVWSLALALITGSSLGAGAHLRVPDSAPGIVRALGSVLAQIPVISEMLFMPVTLVFALASIRIATSAAALGLIAAGHRVQAGYQSVVISTPAHVAAAAITRAASDRRTAAFEALERATTTASIMAGLASRTSSRILAKARADELEDEAEELAEESARRRRDADRRRRILRVVNPGQEPTSAMGLAAE